MSAVRAPRVVVVGAGMGGLVSALLLAARGVSVTLVEAGAAPGGKMRQQVMGDARIDAGPTVFTMRWVFESILDEAGFGIDRLPALRPLQVLARHAWRASPQRLDLLADPVQAADAIAQFAGPAEARRYEAFCREARAVYQAVEPSVIRGPRPTLPSMVRALGPSGLATLAGLGPMASLWRRLGHHFRDPRLRQLFGRYATYCGGSPWLAPATLMLVAHVEQSGVWSVQGGMHALAQALAGLATARGASLRYGTRCEHIGLRDGRVCGVRLAGGEWISADAVVFNGDTNALAKGFLGSEVAAAVPPTPTAERSLSAVTWAVHGRTEGFPLVRHNVFFDDDYEREFRDVFQRRELPGQGTVYVCAQDRDDTGKFDGAERLLLLVNAPPDGDKQPLDAPEIDACLNRSLALMQHAGLRLETQARRVATTPTDFHRMFPGTGGALYGAATHGWMSVFRRSGANSRVPGLMLSGGSVHPGPGVPMAALSGRQAAAAVMAHLASTRRFHPVATSGGTSMRSATMADTG